MERRNDENRKMENAAKETFRIKGRKRSDQIQRIREEEKEKKRKEEKKMILLEHEHLPKNPT